MDEQHFEHAAKLEQHLRDEALKSVREKNAAAHWIPPDFDGTCPECGEVVQPARVALGYYSCIDCARARELRDKLQLQSGPSTESESP